MSKVNSGIKFKLLVITAFVILCSAFKLLAAEAYTDLTLSDAVKIGLKNNIQQRVSLQAAAIAESQYQEALSARWPTISLQVSATRMGEDPTFLLPSTTISIANIATPLNGLLGGSVIPSTLTSGERKLKLMDRDTAIATLQLMMPLYTGGKITSLVNQASLGKEIAQEEYHRSTLQVVRDVKRYYYAVKLTQDLSELAHETVETLQSTRDLTKTMYEGGSGSINKLDYLKTEMAVNYARSLEAEFLAKGKSAISALTLAMGVPWSSTIKIAHEDFPKSNSQPALESLIAQAQQFNPEMGEMKLAVKMADERINEAKSAYYPQVAFTGNVKHIENGYDGGLLNDDNKNSWTIGVVMNMPIFDFGKTSSHVNSAKLERNQMDEKQLLVEQGLAAQIKNLFINLEAANQQVTLTQKTVEFAKDYERLTNQAYQIGASKPEDMIQASIYSALVEGTHLRAQHDSANSEAEIEYFIGSQVN
ncbi:MAG TPA: TolC family protein [Methylophilaceae bacterium]|jgi:outer membrane protein TolC